MFESVFMLHAELSAELFDEGEPTNTLQSVFTLHAELSAELFDEGGPTNTLTGRE